MIRINLLPPSLRKSKSRLRIAVPWRKVIVWTVSVVALYSVWLFSSIQIQRASVSRMTAQRDKVKAERMRVENTEAALRAFQNRAGVLKILKAPEQQWAPRWNLLTDALVANLWFVSLEYKPVEIVVPDAKAGKKKMKVRDKAKASETGKSNKKKESGRKSSKKGSAEEKPEKVEKVRASLVLKGVAFVAAHGEGSPVTRYIQRLKQNPEFVKRFVGLELKMVEHRQVQKEEVSDFIIHLFPKAN